MHSQPASSRPAPPAQPGSRPGRSPQPQSRCSRRPRSWRREHRACLGHCCCRHHCSRLPRQAPAVRAQTRKPSRRGRGCRSRCSAREMLRERHDGRARQRPSNRPEAGSERRCSHPEINPVTSPSTVVYRPTAWTCVDSAVKDRGKKSAFD